MKKSRFICGIVTVIYIVLCVFLNYVLLKDNINNKSELAISTKFIHIAAFVLCVGLYIVVRARLIKKVASTKIINEYCNMFIAIIVFVTRLGMFYYLGKKGLKFNPSYALGLGSYINYGLGIILKKQVYANVIINTIMAIFIAVMIKKILFKMTSSDVVSTIGAIIYIFLPKALINTTNYIRYEYNTLIALAILYLFIITIENIKKFNIKDYKYIVYSCIIGLLEAIDIVLGGSYIFWVLFSVIMAITTNYVGHVKIRIKDEFKKKLNYKQKITCDKLERLNISKFIIILAVSLTISLVARLICNAFEVKSVVEFANITGIYSKALLGSRSYFLLLNTLSFIFYMIGIILGRNIDSKFFGITVLYILTACLVPYLTDAIYSTYLLDTLLSMLVVTNVANICVNREEKIKLLKDKN